MKAVVQNKLKRLSLEMIKTHMVYHYDLNVDVSLVDYSVKDFNNNKVFLSTKDGVKLKKHEGFSEDKLLRSMVDNLKSIIKAGVN